MTTTAKTFILFALLLSACARQQQVQPAPVQPAPPVAGKQVFIQADAIAVVLADIQRRGGDPKREECSAVKDKRGWSVTAWHIWYPQNTGSSRFVPGGFTTYVVSDDGKIVEVQPGL